MTGSGNCLGSAAIAPLDNALSCADFVSFFKEVHGCEPFPWQVRLTEQVLEKGVWPKVIDLPTGSGKTAVIDTAVFALAANPATSPRRIVFVIDRRIVVDQVFERAQRIKCRLDEANTPILKQIQSSLHELSGGKSLGVAALRGGVPIEGAWAQRPDQPWIVVSTVDQFGSRLLFRGYGVTPRMRPVHAGLAGNDCLVFLDEVQISVPFAETLARVSELPRGPLPRRYVTVEMSATPKDTESERFVLNARTDLEGCPELRRRVWAAKQAELRRILNVDKVPADVLKVVRQIDKSNRKGETHQVRSIGVVVNRVRTARETHNFLANAGHRTYLLTGRMRPLDRIDLLDQIEPVVAPDREQTSEELSLVVATQAIEVGADFSFDALITECAPVDSLRQRFGRLDRRGTWSESAGSPAQAWILGLKSVVGSKKPDPIYGQAIRETWGHLDSRVKDGKLDVGPLDLLDFPKQSSAPRALAPLLLKSHMDAWVQTNPETIVQPSLDWFLHGIDQNRPPEVSILWRYDRSPGALNLVPPRQAEMLQLPLSAVKSWLAGGSEVDVVDVGQEAGFEGSYTPTDKNVDDWVRWNGIGDGVESVEIGKIRPGDVLVVHPGRGGLNAGNWDPTSSELVEDLGDSAQLAYGRRATMRLDTRLNYVKSPPNPEGEAIEDTSVSDLIAKWLEDLSAELERRQDWVSETIARLLQTGFDIELAGEDEGAEGRYYILVERQQNTRKPLVDITVMDGSDETGSLTGTETSLSQHLAGVGERAGRIAERLYLPSEIVADIRLAGELHDLGKVDPRIQLQLVGGDPVEMEMRRGKPLAKSLRDARRVWKYPRGMRHELASVAMIESNREILGPAHDTELVLHLIATHHGFARPLPPIIEDADPKILSFELNGIRMKTSSNLVKSSMALEMADRFWRLVECYGYHGLALLEAIIRLADHQQSAKESTQS